VTCPSSRFATVEDVPELVRLYRLLDEEMAALRPAWSVTEGLPEPIDRALDSRLEGCVVGLFDGVPVGFLVADLAAPICGIEIVFTHPEARGVGVGEAMVRLLISEARTRGVTSFDVAVLPGHRAAKNFFEGEGFKARLIIMHRDE
jgi:GNAT superfamily N-acetyltransferase